MYLVMGIINNKDFYKYNWFIVTYGNLFMNIEMLSTQCKDAFALKQLPIIWGSCLRELIDINTLRTYLFIECP